MGRFDKGDLIRYRWWSSSAPPIIKVQEQVQEVYILIAPDGQKFIRPVINVDNEFEGVVTFSDDELLG